MTTETKMNELLKGVVQNSALTTEMLDNIKQLKDDNKEIVATIAKLKGRAEDNIQTINAQVERVQILVAQNSVFVKREEQLQNNKKKAKSLIGRIFQINADEYQTITEIFKKADDNAANKAWDGKGQSPRSEYRMIMVTAARILADLADS